MLDLGTNYLLLLGAITLFAAMAQAITGFGFALLTLPFFVLLMDVQSAVQLTLISTFAITLLLLPLTYRHTPKTISKQLAIGALFGFPLGLVFLHYATSTAIQLFVGSAIIAALAAPLLARKLADSGPSDSSSGSGSSSCSAPPVSIFKTGLYGFVSGIMTTSIAMPGPALAFYARHQQLDKQQTRAMIFTLFMFVYLVAIALQWWLYGINPTARDALAFVLVPAVIGTVFGNLIAGHIPEALFRKLINTLLGLTALYLLGSNGLKLIAT